MHLVSSLSFFRKFDAFIHDAVFLNQVPREIADIHIRHAARVIAEQKQVEMQLFFLGEQGSVYIGDFFNDLIGYGFGSCFRPLDIIAQA